MTITRNIKSLLETAGKKPTMTELKSMINSVHDKNASFVRDTQSATNPQVVEMSIRAQDKADFANSILDAISGNPSMLTLQ